MVHCHRKNSEQIILKMKPLNIITGHYGSGKTNIAVNLALLEKKLFPAKKISIADVDIVNPYFRTADSRALLEENGIEVLLPEFANSNVDIPALPPKLITLFECGDENAVSIIDVGGDDGAVALGMYKSLINKADYEMFYVINAYRPLISDPHDAIDCMREIETVSGVRVTSIINNSSIGEETTARDILDSVSYARECERLAKIPLAAHTYCAKYAPDAPDIFPESERAILIPIRDITKKLF